ncbi:MAG: dual specificity protein phosphatase family protein [Candidatus Latescibacteria bacterium]|nr:dual specificity protein phosphatase family protein [Candidatus Latescibacterota bacterium]
MNFILDRLAIGTYDDAVNLGLLESHDITGVLDLTIETAYSLPPRILRLKVPMEDGVPLKPDHIRLSINWLRQAIRERRILVHCMAGISRSPSIAMCYLYECGFSFEDAYDLIKSKRLQANPHPALVESIREYYGMP